MTTTCSIVTQPMATGGWIVPLVVPRVVFVERHGSALHNSPLADAPDILSLNLTRGCAHQCSFCSIRGHAAYPGDDVIYLFSNTAELLEEELAGRRRKPRAVFVSPATDPFPPLGEVQAMTTRVVEVLAQHGVAAWLMTRGAIRPAALGILAKHRASVRVTVGLTTLDRLKQRVLEPLAAPPRLRLRQIRTLQGLGIGVQVAVEPLVPGLTDTAENLKELLALLASAGVRRITASYLFLRSGIANNLRRTLEPCGWDEPVLGAFTGGPLLESGTLTAARYLPKNRRQRGYSALMALAAEHGITVSISGLTNPDFLPTRRPEGDLPRPRLLPRYAEIRSEQSLFRCN